MLHEIIIYTIDNPLDGVLPDFNVFGAEFTQLWQKLLAGIWGLAIVVSIVFIIMSITKMGAASNSQNPQEYKSARKQFTWSLIALGGLAALSVIIGAVLALFG